MRENKQCASLEEPPLFAYTDSATVNAAAADGARALSYAIFGLGADLATKAGGKAAASCQFEMLKRANNLQNTVLKEFNRAQKRALKDEAVGSATALEVKLQAVFASNGKIKRAQRMLTNRVDRKCAALETPPAMLFPGSCGESAPNLGAIEACVIAAARCEACGMINAFGDLNLDCDQADDPTVYGSCPLPEEHGDSGGFNLTNADCFPESLPDSAPAIAKMCVDLANSAPDMQFRPTDYQSLPEDCKAIVHPECRF